MEDVEIKFIDESGDKDYFTIIPNYVLNHSTIYDREVYIQMKRIAGEKGKCFMSIPKLALKCGIGKERLQKSIKYLIKQKWISFSGKISIQTKGGQQIVNSYKVENIWKLNSSFFKGGSPQTYPFYKGGSPKGGRQRGVAKGGSPQGREEEPIKEEPIKEEPIKKNKDILSGKKPDPEAPILYLNEKAGRSFGSKNKANRDLVEARYKEGRTLEQFKKVINKKVADWGSDENMMKYLRPETLFSHKHFESYLNEPKSMKEMEMEIGI